MTRMVPNRQQDLLSSTVGLTAEREISVDQLAISAVD
jgi:hypothetical protein